MSKIITFSRRFPSYHPKAGQPTYFVEKFWKQANYIHGENVLSQELENLNAIKFEPKNHTIRSGQRFKKGDYFSPRVWGNDINPKSGRSGAYHSKQIIIAPDTLITNVWDFEISKHAVIYLNRKPIYEFCGEYTGVIKTLAENDGLEPNELLDWFQYPKPFCGQVIVWNENIKY